MGIYGILIVCISVPVAAYIIISKPWKIISIRAKVMPRFLLTKVQATLTEKSEQKNEINETVARPAAMKKYTMDLDLDHNVYDRLLVFETEVGNRSYLVDKTEYNKRKKGEQGTLYVYKRAYIKFKPSKNEKGE